MVNYRPYEQNTLEALLSSGLIEADPQSAYSILQGVQGGALERMQAQQAQNQDMMQTAMGQLQSYASDPASTMNGLNALTDSYQAVNPQLAKPKFDSRLEDLVGSLQPLAAMKPPPDPNAPQDPATATQLSPDEISAMWKDAMTFAQPDPDTGAQMPLHEARLRIVGQLRQLGYPDPVIQQAYNLVGSAYQAAGGLVGNAPISYGNRLEDLAAPAQAPAGGQAPSDLGPYLGALQQLMPQDPTLGTDENPSWLPSWLNGDAMLRPQNHGMQSWADALNPFS